MMPSLRSLPLLLCCTICAPVGDATATADDQWIEVKSAHFTLVSNANERSTRTLAWQLEQIRTVVGLLWPWARVDSSKPLLVLAVKDENTMRSLAPQYWEGRDSLHPASVWVGGVDQYYLAIRADLRSEDNATLNPHITAYASYVNLVLNSSMAGNTPLWFNNGISGVLSNTIVRDTEILLGAPIPWHLQHLQERVRLKLSHLIAVTHSSPEYLQADLRGTFDAQCWALVHYLIFGDRGTHAAQLNAFAALLNAGKDADTSFREAFGPPEQLEAAFFNYINRNIFSGAKARIDAAVKREGFGTRKVPPAEAAATRATFHVAMRRPTEARTLISEAQRADAKAPGSYLAEAMLLDADRKTDDARTAYAKAVELGTTNAYAPYRLAGLLWQPQADRARLLEIEQALSKAIALNNRFAAAYAYLGDVKASLGAAEDAALPLVRRAISLEPAESSHRLVAARILLQSRKFDEAEKEASIAMSLAQTDDARAQVKRTLADIENARRRL